MGKNAKKRAAKKQQHMSRKDRFDQVLIQLWECGRVGGCSRREIAERLGLAYSPHLINMIEELVTAGWVDRSFNPDRPSAGYRYMPSARLEKWHAERGAA